MNFEDRYGALDRLLHRIAFRAGLAQRTLAEVEQAIYGDRLRSVPLDDPVFITALPRSGTTILLKLLVETGRFASHTYRDMPFILAPMLWHRFSRPFAVDDAPKERAHGDGLQVSADSPEAFEETIWKHFWPEHYERDRIRPWTAEEGNREFAVFFETHMRKIIALRRDGPEDGRRYVSKNNLNIARIAGPPAPLDAGTWLVPFREPVQQAASMLRQHRRFLQIHDEDDFVREYMEAIGHHEFGKGLKPVDFGGWLKEASDPEGLEFWLRYWLAAYRHVLKHKGPPTVIISYRRLTRRPEKALARLAEIIGTPRSDLVALAAGLHPPRDHDTDTDTLPGSLLQEARDLRDQLRERANV